VVHPTLTYSSRGTASYIARLHTSSCSSNHRLPLVTASAFVSISRKLSLSILTAFNAKFSIHSLSAIFSIRAEVQLTSSVQFTAYWGELRDVNLLIEDGWYMNESETCNWVPIDDDFIILHLLV